MKEIDLIAPIIRGLTFDGERGAYVVTGEKVPQGSGILRFEGAKAEALRAGDIEAVRASWTSYLQEAGKLPGAVVVADSVGTRAYFLGNNYDDAAKAAGKGEAVSFDRPAGSSSRADVVRDKIAVVTGGAQGFGAGIVKGLTAEGAFVFIADMNVSGAKALADELNGKAGKTVALPAEVNVTDEDSVAAMAAFIVAQTGGLDLFINNAGVVKAGSVKEIPLKDFNFVTAVNYTGYYLCVKHVSPVMAAQNDASGGNYPTDIIQINSKSGLEGSNKNGAYAGSKFGGIGLTESFALELVTDRIKVNSICPGNFFDGPLWSDPEKGLFVQYLNLSLIHI